MPAIVIAIFTFGIGAVALNQAPDIGEVAVVFAPGTDPAKALALIAAADGKIVGPTRLSNIHVAYAQDPGFGRRIRQLGAWTTLTAQGLCAPFSRKPD